MVVEAKDGVANAGREPRKVVGIRNKDQNVDAEAQLNSILNIVSDAIITIDENGTIASFSPGAEKLFGYGALEVIGNNVNTLMPTPYHEEHDGYLAHYRSTGEKKIIGIGREVEAKRKDGSTFPINLAVNEMLVDGQRMFTGVVHDISALKNAQSMSNRFGNILERSLNEIYVFDDETLRFVQVNRGARENMGYSADEFSEMTPVDIKPELTSEQFAELIQPLRDNAKKPLVFKTVHQRKDGSTYPVEVNLQLMIDETPNVFVAIIMDISETERRDALLRQSQKMEAVGQLTGGIAHDFNNLLTVILGNNELLAGRLAGDERSMKFLSASTGAAERGAQLTSQLLSFARQQPLDTKVIDLNKLVSDMKGMLQRTLGETVTLGLDLAPSLGNAQADANQLHNAILNLAINARDAMPEGGRLVIETSNVDFDPKTAAERIEVDPGQYVRISVSDTGTGMSAETQTRVLEPFFTTKEQGKGTGLGLSMVHGFAKQSGGHLDIYSELGHGTTVNLYLPDATENVSIAAAPGARSSIKEACGETVLVVEDDPRVREITVTRLEHLGYQVVEAENGQAALDFLADGQIVDVILTDMVMPGGMNGAELVQKVRETNPEIKVIIASGYAEGGQMPANGTPWLRKPYKLDELARTLRELLD